MQRIPVRTACGPAVAPVSPYQSLSQRVAELRKVAAPRPDEVARLYDRLFLEHFGKPSRRVPSLRDNTSFGRVLSWCLNHDVRVEDFISANMLLLRHRLGRHAFRPNMLCGPGAEARYNGVLGRANRRFARGDVRVFGRETRLGFIRMQLQTTEHDIADLWCSLALAGDPITWDQAVESVKRTDEWTQYQARRGCWLELVNSYGREAAEREGLLASLSAAWQIAERFQVGLADRIGIVDWSWAAFLRLLQHVLPKPKPKPESEFAEFAGGKIWGNW